MPLSRRTYLRRRGFTFGFLGVALAGSLYVSSTLLAPLPPVSAVSVAASAPTQQPSSTEVSSAEPSSAEVSLDWPGFGSSALGAVGFPDLLVSHGPTTPRPIASITKIVTSLVVLDKMPLQAGSAGPTITMTAADTARYHSFIARNGEVRPVWAGLTLSLREVLQVVLMASANNYAQSLALWAYGSPQAFLAAADSWLQENGLVHTTLRDSTGMDPGNTSTAADLVALGKLALADDTVSGIVAQKSATIPHLGLIENTNELLGLSGVVGIKTGTLTAAGSCLLFASHIEVEGRRVTLVGVVLGGRDHESLHAPIRELISSAAGAFRVVPLVTAGDTYFTYSTDWGQRARAVAVRGASALAWGSDQAVTAARAVELRNAAAGEHVGSVTVRLGRTQVTVPLALDAPVSDPGPWWRLAHPFG